MIEEPPPLIFAASQERPPSELVERFRGAPTSFIVDAMNGAGALDWRIKRLVGGALVGVALTCDCGPLDNLAFMAALAECRPGDVLVVATGGYVGAAVTGDLLIDVARNRGAAGFVTDGLVRDLDDLETVGLPIFAMGVTPNSPQRRGPGSVGLPIVCGGVTVASGDVVVGDRDGVVVVPRGRIDETLKNLERVKTIEAATLERVRGGLKELPVEVPAAAADRQGVRQRRDKVSGREAFGVIDFPIIDSHIHLLDQNRFGYSWAKRRAGAQARLDARRSRRRRETVRARRASCSSKSMSTCRNISTKPNGWTASPSTIAASSAPSSVCRSNAERRIEPEMARVGQAQDSARRAPPDPEPARSGLRAEAWVSRGASGSCRNTTSRSTPASSMPRRRTRSR